MALTINIMHGDGLNDEMLPQQNKTTAKLY